MKSANKVIQKIQSKLLQNDGLDGQLAATGTFKKLLINDEIHPVIDVNISSCYAKLCLGGVRKSIIMVNDQQRFPKISPLYMKECNETLANARLNIERLLKTAGSSEELEGLRLIVLYNQGLISQSCGDYASAHEKFK